MNLHDLTYDPVGLWQFQESLVDSSGNGFDLELSAGVERYTEIFYGIRALKLSSSTRYVYNVAGSLLQIAGDITIEMILALDGYPSGNALVSYSAVGETEAANTLYNFGFISNQFIFLSESGAGVDATYSSERALMLGHVCHIAVRRMSNEIQIFANGLPFGTPGTLTAPTGGSSGTFWLGDSTAGAGFTVPSTMASLKIIPRALTDDEIKSEYNLTMGGVYGRLD